MNEINSRNFPRLMYFAVPAIPLIAAGNYSLGMNPEVALFVWEFLALLLCGWVSISRPVAMKNMVFSPSFITAAAFSAWVLLSVLWSVVFNDALWESLRYLTGFLLFATIVLVRPDEVKTRRVIFLLFAAASIAALYGIYQGAWGFSKMLRFASENNFSAEDIRLLKETQRPFSTFFHTNAFAGYLAAMIPLAALFIFGVEKKSLKLLAVLMLAFLVVALMYTMSRGGWLCAATGMLAMLPYLLKRRGAAAAVSLILIALFSVAIFYGIDKASEMAQGTGTETSSAVSPVERIEALGGEGGDVSVGSRISYWKTALRMGVDFQPMGAGMGAYEHLNRKYLEEPVYSRNPHNIWIQFFAEIGIVGFLLFAAFIVSLLREALREIKSGGKGSETVYVLTVSLLVMLLHSSFDLDIDGPAFGFTLFVFAGLIVSRRQSGLPEAAAGSTEIILRTVVVAVLVVAVVGLHFLNMIASNYSQLSDISAENGSQEKAAGFIDESMDVWPFNPVIAYKQSVMNSNLFDKTGNAELLEKALDGARKAVELNPYQSEYYAGLAMLYEQKGAKQDALEAASKAADLYPIGIRYHTLFAHMTALDGRRSEALNIIDNALRHAENYVRFKSPDGYDVLEAMFVKASILNDMKEFDKALTVYDSMSEYLDRGLVISPFSSSRRVKESHDGIRTRIAEFRKKTELEKTKAELDKSEDKPSEDKSVQEVVEPEKQ